MAKMIIDDKEVEARDGLTLLDVFRKIGVNVPTLCHHEAVSPYGACRLCLVEVTMGRRNMLAASCLYPVTEGIIVKTDSERVLRARRMVAELLLARSPNVPYIQQIAREQGITEPRFKKRDERCVLCGLCVRGCREIAGVGAIDFSNRGVYMEVVTSFKILSEACVGCTTCVYLCPTDAIWSGDIRELSFAKSSNGDQGLVTPHYLDESMPRPIVGVTCTLGAGYMNPRFQEIEASGP